MKADKKEGKNRVVTDRVPTLEKGINLVKGPSKPVFQEVLSANLSKNAVWVDVGNTASTYELDSRSSSIDILQRVRIGRAFTPFQHLKLIKNLDMGQEDEILALTNITALYKDISDTERQEMFSEMWKKVIELQREYNLKVMVSMKNDIGVSYLVEGSADNIIEAEEERGRTVYGSKDYQENFYIVNGLIQTKMPYWSDEEKRVIRKEVKV